MKKAEITELVKARDIQTLIFDKKVFPKRSDATKWARDHDFRADKVDSTENTFRLRQRSPGDFVDGTLRTFSLTRGVQAVGGKLKASKKKGFWSDLF